MAFTADQRRNAGIIISVGRQLGASSRDILIALMAALVESGLRSGLTEARSDADSAGLFQQRRAWAPGGSESYRLNPVNAARMFFLGGHQGQRGLLDYSGRSAWSLGAAAQKVQVSAFPGRYATQENTARQLLGGAGVTISGGSGGAGFIRPVSGGLGRAWGVPNPIYASGYHTGQDFRVPTGTPVRATAAGVVVRVASGGAYGNRVEISHAGKIYSLYAHLSSTMMRAGQTVRQGQIIGRSGSSGTKSSGPHLHFEIRVGANRYGSNVDPMKYINGNTTSSAFIDAGETTVPPGEMDMDAIMKALEEQVGLTRPYAYINPVDMFTEPRGAYEAPSPYTIESYGAVAPPTVTGTEDLRRPVPLEAQMGRLRG